MAGVGCRHLGTGFNRRAHPPDFFGIPFGLLGLADCWLVAAHFWLATVTIGRLLWFAFDSPHLDIVVRVLAGYGVMMVPAQLRLLPGFLALKFMPSFWAFTFSWAAASFAGLFRLGVAHSAGWRAESWAALVLITLFIGAIAARTAIALNAGTLLPKPPPVQPVIPDPAPSTTATVPS